jgi:cullin-associated NEDD8-dissociated protein 1
MNAASTTYLNSLVEKSSDWDKDERYMATNDLCNELSKDIKIDEAMERRICAAVLKQLGM